MVDSEKILWQWCYGHWPAPRRREAMVNAAKSERLWLWLFELNSTGAYVRAERGLKALRAYAKALVHSGCVDQGRVPGELAMADLADSLWPGTTAPRRRNGPPARPRAPRRSTC